MDRDQSWAVIERYGRRRFEALVVQAIVVLKEDRRLVGCDRLRAALARAACARAIGCSYRTFIPSKAIWSGKAEIPEFCEELISACALRLRLGGKVAFFDDCREAG